MSLVNDMLRDLETRQREGATGYRTVPKNGSVSRRSLWLIILILLIMIGVVIARPEWTESLFAKQSVTSVAAPSPIAQATPVEPSAPVSVAAPQEAPVENVVEPVVENQLRVINWTQLDADSGYLTLWLDQVTPFTVLSKEPERFTFKLDQLFSEAKPLEPLPSMLKQLEIKAESTSLVFTIESTEAVTFSPELKQNPPRLKINIGLLNPTVAQASVQPDATQAVVAKNNTNASVDTQPQAVSVAPTSPPVAKPSEGSSTGAMAAAGEWRKSTNTQPNDATTVRNARRLLADSRTDEAIQLLQAFVESSKQTAQSRYLLVQLFLATERYTQADRLLKTAPDNLSWALLKARSLLQQSQGVEAIAVLKRFSAGVTREDYLELLAGAYQQAGQHSEAVTQYLSLLALNPQNARWWVNMGVSLEYLGQQAKALDAYRSALKIPTIDTSLKQFAQRQAERLIQ